MTWSAWARETGCDPSVLSAGIRYSEKIHPIQATVAVQGVGLLSLLLVEDELRMGLLQVAAEATLQGMSDHLLQPGRRPPRDAVAAISDWLLRTASQRPLPSGYGASAP